MTELVFLPDRSVERDQAMTELVRAAGPSANVVIASAVTEVAGPAMADMASTLRPARGRKRKRPDMEIVDVVAQSGAMLVALPRTKDAPEVAGGQLYPVVNYRPAIAEVRVGRSRMRLDSGPPGAEFLQIRLRSSKDQAPIAEAVARLRLRGSGQEVSAVSDGDGVVTFGLRAPGVEEAVLLVEPGFAGHWGYFNQKASFASGATFDIDPVNLSQARDSLRHVLQPGDAQAGKGVRVAIIDSGVGPHADLSNALGDEDSSIGHGTHVAGIIGGTGKNGHAGMAPGVEIRSYRVFADPATGIARNFDIHRAIEQSVEDECHLINMSLKSEFRQAPLQDDVVISRAVEDAADAGVLSIAAAGNDFRRFVAFPARHPDVLAVSALGWEPGIPDNAYDRWTISEDRGDPDDDLYFAAFSNEGVEGTSVDIIGPGAGVVSAVPGNAYAPMSGTSMACPAMTGTIARILAAQAGVLAMAPSRERTEKMREHALQDLRQLGFGAKREGGGMVP